MSEGMPDDKVVLVLKSPIVLKDKTIDQIEISEPTAGQMAMAENGSKDKGSHDQAIILLGLVTNLHPTIIKQLKGSDYVKAQKILGNFFSDGPVDGENE